MAKKLTVFLTIAASVLILDQLTKFWVLDELTNAFPPGASSGEKVSRYFGKAPEPGPFGYHYNEKRFVNVADKFFRIRYAENTGAAWGMLRELPERLRLPFFHLVSLGAVVAISYFFFKLTGDPKEKWVYFGLPLVLGGALGNYLDRLSRGFVIDFLQAHWMDKAYWPSFNVADTAISIGVGMLMLDALVRKEGKATSPRPSEVR